uniref:Uncharacterized protein n=1 Tax=Mycena chlorophos TaxID=658473 RepID=A0ABQ0LMJ8_MYCCL|nr:predicted protein [Mycena chlorophos]
MNCQFSFGPRRSYFCSAGIYYAWSHGTVPSTLQRILDDPRHPQAMATPYDVAFPTDTNSEGFAMCWRTSRDELCADAGRLPASYARLARFVHSTTTIYGASTTRTVFGPHGAFFSMSDRGYAWQNLPAALEEDLQSAIRVRRPMSVALGVGGAYVVLYNDGTINFDLRGAYPLVESIIRDTGEATRRKGILYIALNPHVPGEFYLVFGDASVRWAFPAAWSPDVTAVSREIRRVEANTPPASVTGVSTGGTTPSSPTDRAPSPGPSVLSSLSGNSTSSTGSGPTSSAAHTHITVPTPSPVLRPATVAFGDDSNIDNDAPPAYAPIASRPSSPISQSHALSFSALYSDGPVAGSSRSDESIPYRPHSIAIPSSASASGSTSHLPTRVLSSASSTHSAPVQTQWPGDAKNPNGPRGETGGRFHVANAPETHYPQHEQQQQQQTLHAGGSTSDDHGVETNPFVRAVASTNASASSSAATSVYTTSIPHGQMPPVPPPPPPPPPELVRALSSASVVSGASTSSWSASSSAYSPQP